MAFQFERAPFRHSGRRIKTGLHCHTTRSDGGLSPGETVGRYHAEGFHCVGIADHGQVTELEGPPGEEVLVLPATENGGDPDIIGIGVESAVDPSLSLSERAAALAGQGGFTIAAHPTYCGVLPSAYTACDDLMALETYNAYCDAAYTNGYAFELWDMVLGQGKRVWGVAADDAHLNPRKRYYSDAGLGWVEVWADALTPESVLSALKQGAFFSTQGPVFDEFAVDENTISLACSRVEQIRWRTFGKVGYVEYASEDSLLTSSSLPDWFRPNQYVRIELVDGSGRRAWSNPFFVGDGVANGA